MATKKKITKRASKSTKTGVPKKRGSLTHATAGPACELCGKRGKAIQTECCGHWICDDEQSYVMFSYSRNSCLRNHRRYTLCGSHFNEGHGGRWQDCRVCRDGFEPEMVAWYGTNEFNFEKMEHPPAFEPTLCAKCRTRINLGTDGYSMSGKAYFCMRCGAFALGRR